MKKFLLFFLFLSTSHQFSQTLIGPVDLPTGTYWNSAYGMVYNNSKYWISSSSTTGRGIFYAINSSGIPVDTLNIDLSWIRESQGLAYDGTDFWYVERKTARCDLYKISTTGIVIDSIPTAELFGSNSIYLGGAAWDGDGLWISVYSPDAITAVYKINVAARAIVDTIPVVGLQPTGITVKGDTLIYVNDGFSSNGSQGYDSVYAVNKNSKDRLFSFGLPHPANVQNSPRGLAWDGENFWLIAEPVGGTGRQLFKYDLEGSGTPEIFVPITNLNFPNTTVGNTSNSIVQIFNTGTATLFVDSIKVNGSVFTINPLSFPLQITPGNSANVTMNFTPTNYAWYTGNIQIYNNDPISPVVQVNLAGRGLLNGARIGLTATSHNFGDVWVGQEGIAFWKFKTFNMGNAQLQINNIIFTLPEYTFDSPAIPFVLNPTDSVEITVFFYPLTVGSYIDSLNIFNNDLTNQLVKIPLQGTGIFNNYNYGYSFWQYQVPPHPNSSSASPRVEGLKYINDITGDGIPEVIISTENYWTMCLDGAASGTSYPLWVFTTYMSSNNAGSIGQNFEYGVQDAIQIASDLNHDGFNDVVLAVGGGNESVYALNGLTGQIIWYYGDDINWSLGDFSAVDVQRDFNGDGVVDVLAIADGNDDGTGYKRAYLFNGNNGNIIWEHFYPGPNPSFGKTIISFDDINGDNIPEAIIAYGNNGTTNKSVRALNGVNGQTIWTRDMVQSNPKELLQLPLAGGGSDIIVAEYFNRIHRINGTTGEIIWTYPLGSSAGVIQMALIDDVNSDSIPEVVIASFAANGVNCLSGADGSQLWAWQMDFQFGVAAVPDLTNDGSQEVLVGSRDTYLYCINGRGDSLIFTQQFSDWLYTVNIIPSIDGNFSYELLAGTRDGKVASLSGGTFVVPVELTSFTANEINGKIFLNWTTATEKNNFGFDIERTAGSDLNWEKIGFVQGSGTTTEFRIYSFIDEQIIAGTFSYRLKQIDYNGDFEYSDIVEIIFGSPQEYALEQNFPNPFNPVTTIRYALKEKSLVVLKIYDVLGEEVATLVNEEQVPGTYNLEFNASQFSSGIYFYQLRAGDPSSGSGQGFVSTKKMVLLK